MEENQMAAGMRRDFTDRDDLVRYVREAFPQATTRSPHIAAVRGGRSAGEAVLDRIDPAVYAQTRNHLDGQVTGLSPYIRYGIISLDEVRTAALERVRRRPDAAQLIQELAWRDYYQHLYRELGIGIWEDIEPYKTGFHSREYSHLMPEDVLNAATGTCMDPFIETLYRTGYLHNHARMWLAAYLVHWRRVRWQTGATWFLMHLLDGDPASNNLSWQWVASTFSHKPYYYNLENLRRFGAEVDGFDNRPFEGSYEEVSRRLFPRKPAGATW